MKTLVDSGALTMALNVLRRAGKDEVADALEKTAIRGPELRVPLTGTDIVGLASFAGFQIVGEEVEDDGYLDAQYGIVPCPEAGVRVNDDVLRFDYVVVNEEDPDQGCLPLGEGVPLDWVTPEGDPADAFQKPGDRVSQDDAALMQATAALALYRAGESAEYMANAIEALLQPAPKPKESTKCRALHLLDKHGICLTCGELYEHDYNTPFASCGCCQSEWYEFTPHMLAVKAAKEQ